ncbi:6-phosphofructo-2-kinase/fructose-2,6-bisphosphatase-like [Zingiber officinale]|uniref:6-phosphofructo-2-kinase/fructose-2, 6-bisphosphatase-like n=1 Tax=Zingiber officinale TaxID=94328 RepID=UPI001C4D7A67|nr:6-phosphofructo-2-kinase/fructose-2,6-bisphosphatase-like [Zingiber officinale]
MGTGASRNSDCSHGGREGQLYVALKMENFKVRGDLVPHVYGSIPITGSWDAAKALSMARESASMWELSFVVPPDHETLDFKFLLKPKNNTGTCVVEEGQNRLLTGGALEEGDSRPALFKIGDDEVLEFRVFIKVDILSPFDLAASWRAYQENIEPSRVRGIPDVSINVAVENGSTPTLELDLEHYVVPAPSSIVDDAYAANLTETPRSLSNRNFSKYDASTGDSYGSNKAGDSSNHREDMDTFISDPPELLPVPGMVESKSVGAFSPVPKQDGQKGLFVDRGVGSPRLVKSASGGTFTFDLKLDSETKKGMPAAAGAVAAAAVADQMLGSEEDSRLAIVLVGLPARGKTFTAAKLTRYLRWLGHETKHFNVGKYRRLKLGTNQSADFFRGDNPEGMEARNEVAALAMDDMIAWMQEGGQVGIFDATNSSRKRRNMLMKMAAGKCKIIFLETICNDERIIESNIRLKIQQSPDYAEEIDFEAGMRDFKERLDNYEKAYEPVEEGSYIKMIDMVNGQGGQIQVNNISGYLPGRIVFFLVNTHLTPRPILLTRHGESRNNVRGRIGGDAVLSEAGELYAKKLANFVEKRLKSEKTASIWTSTLQRTILTASAIVGFPKIQWRALEEINAGVCDGMTYEEIKKNMPEEYESRKKDKLRYRYPRGESYLDIIQRLEPVIIELERQRAPVVVISHQAVLRALYAYFADRPLNEIPLIEVPFHTIIEIQMGVTGVQEKRYKLMG